MSLLVRRGEIRVGSRGLQRKRECTGRQTIRGDVNAEKHLLYTTVYPFMQGCQEQLTRPSRTLGDNGKLDVWSYGRNSSWRRKCWVGVKWPVSDGLSCAALAL